jgi:uncharacterized membrane protein YdjX (TVP38/TMEM64 family)
MGILILVVGLVATSDTLHGQVERLIRWAETLIAESPRLGMLVFVLLAMLSSMLAFFSSALLAPVAIYAWGGLGCMALLWLGWLLGGIASFCIGRFLGHSVAVTLLGEKKITGWRRELGERARFIHVLAFQAMVPSEIPGYVLGTLRYRFRTYLAALAITEIPYAAAVVFLGESFIQREANTFLFLGSATIVLGFCLLRIIKTFRGRLPMDRQGQPGEDEHW